MAMLLFAVSTRPATSTLHAQQVDRSATRPATKTGDGGTVQGASHKDCSVRRTPWTTDLTPRAVRPNTDGLRDVCALYGQSRWLVTYMLNTNAPCVYCPEQSLCHALVRAYLKRGCWLAGSFMIFGRATLTGEPSRECM